MSMSGHEKPNKGGTDVWLTPLPIIEKLGPFDLDPCGESHWPTASTIYTECGLEREWFGLVWLNPPYSEVGKWMARLAEHGNGMALVFNRTDVGWWHDAAKAATAMLFMRGRIVFHHGDGTRAKGNAGAPSVLIAFGNKAAERLMNSGINGLAWRASSTNTSPGGES